MRRSFQLPVFPRPTNSLKSVCHWKAECGVLNRYNSFSICGRFLNNYYCSQRYQSNKPDFSNIPGVRIPKKLNKNKAKRINVTKEQMNDAFQSCLKTIQKHDYDKYLSILLMPKNVQPALVAINAFNVEIATVRDKISTKTTNTTGLYRLKFWSDAIESIFGSSPLPIPRQPVAVMLSNFANGARLELLHKIIESRQSTIGDKPFMNTDELINYGKSAIGSMISMEIDFLAKNYDININNKVIYEIADDLGAAFTIANTIRSTHPLLARGIVILPQDLLSINEATLETIYHKKKLDCTKAVTRDMYNVSKKLLNNCRGCINSIPAELRAPFITYSTTTEYILNTLEKKDYDIYSPYLQRRNPWFLWSLIYKKITGKF